MRSKGILLYLSFRRSLGLFFSPIALVYLVFPLMIGLCIEYLGWNAIMDTYILLAQMLIPLGAAMWVMAYMNIWVNSDAQETLRACYKGKYFCVVDVLLILIVYCVMIIPEFVVLSFLYRPMWLEMLRIYIQIFTLVGVMYLLSNILNSVTLGGMVVMAYLMFSFVFVRDSNISQFCFMSIAWIGDLPQLLISYWQMILVAILTFTLGQVVEHRKGKQIS